jgi:hypothetical protein
MLFLRKFKRKKSLFREIFATMVPMRMYCLLAQRREVN